MIRILHIHSGNLNSKNGISTVLNNIKYVNEYNKNTKHDILSLNHNISSIYNFDYKKYEIIIFHGCYSLYYILIFFILFFNKIPFCIKPHGSFIKKSFHKNCIFKHFYKKIFLNYFVKKAKYLFFINQYERDNSFYSDHSFLISPNYINIISDNKTLNFSILEKFNVLLYSRVDFYHKGLDLFFKFLHQYKDVLLINNFKFNLYGNGDKKSLDKLKYYQNKFDNNLFTYNGPINVDFDLKKIFNENQILLLTSRYEGFPTTIIESFSYGIPVLASKYCNCDFILDKNIGWVFDFNKDNLFNKLLDIKQIYKSNIDQIRSNCLNCYYTEFYLNNNLDKIYFFYEHVLSS